MIQNVQIQKALNQVIAKLNIWFETIFRMLPNVVVAVLDPRAFLAGGPSLREQLEGVKLRLFMPPEKSPDPT